MVEEVTSLSNFQPQQMEVRVSKFLLLLLLITFFVIRPFIVFSHYAASESDAISSVDYLLTKTSLKKREQNSSRVFAHHVSACDNTAFRKKLLEVFSKVGLRFWKEFIFGLAAVFSTLSCLDLKSRHRLLQIISSQQYFYSLSVLRI
jgi:hypothetical protein